MGMGEIYLVAGATGGIGQHIVSRLLRNNAHVRALVRDHAKGRALLGENLELAVGDTRRIDTLQDAANGVSVVICATGTRTPEGMNTPEEVDFEGVRNLMWAAQQANVKHFLLISSIAVTHPEHPLNQFGHVLDWKQKGEQALRESGLTYTIVRPGGLNDEPGGSKAIQIEQGDTISGTVSRSDVAEVCVRALSHNSARNATFEVINAEGEPPQDWDALFAALKSDLEVSANG
jgi:uncharacterized protein YbjT (DUF2867 family)